MFRVNRLIIFIGWLEPDLVSVLSEIFHSELSVHLRNDYLPVLGHIRSFHQHHIPFFYMRIYHRVSVHFQHIGSRFLFDQKVVEVYHIRELFFYSRREPRGYKAEHWNTSKIFYERFGWYEPAEMVFGDRPRIH